MFRPDKAAVGSVRSRVFIHDRQAVQSRMGAAVHKRRRLNHTHHRIFPRPGRDKFFQDPDTIVSLIRIDKRIVRTQSLPVQRPAAQLQSQCIADLYIEKPPVHRPVGNHNLPAVLRHPPFREHNRHHIRKSLSQTGHIEVGRPVSIQFFLIQILKEGIAQLLPGCKTCHFLIL